MPERILTRVDLPAPLSPTRATTSPARTSKSTPSRAWTGPKRLLTPSRLKRAPLVLASVLIESSLIRAPHRATFGRSPGADCEIHHFAYGLIPAALHADTY